MFFCRGFRKYDLLKRIFIELLACNCHPQFSNGSCADETGQCECKSNYGGQSCNRCSKGYHMFPECTGMYHFQEVYSEPSRSF